MMRFVLCHLRYLLLLIRFVFIAFKIYAVAAVADGIKAWDIVEEKNFNFDIILSEVEVPSFSGISLLSRIMGTELSRCIPVISKWILSSLWDWV